MTKPSLEELEHIEKDAEMEIEHEEEGPILLFNELSSFIEEEEEEKVVPILEEKNLAFEPNMEPESLL